MSLVSYLASVRTVRSRESVGYGRLWRAARGTRVGLVPVGYADGYARGLDGPRRRAGGRAPRARGRARSRWTSSPWTSAPRAAEDVGEEVVLIGAPGRRADHRRGASPPGAARSTTRSRAPSAPACRGSTRDEAPSAPWWRRSPRSSGEAWAVGGGVRDALLGRPVADLDVAVAGDAAAAAAALAGPTAARAFACRAPSGRGACRAATCPSQVDITPLQGGRPRRGPRPPRPDGQRPGPAGGRRGADHRPPRRPRRPRGAPPAPGAADGPRRRPGAPAAARAPRRGRLGFAIEAGTRRAGPRATPRRLWDTPGERLADELGRIVSLRAARPGLRAARRARRARARSCPSSSESRGLDQSPYHHKDVLGHTLEVVAAHGRAGRRPRAGLPRPRRPRARGAGRAAGRRARRARRR